MLHMKSLLSGSPFLKSAPKTISLARRSFCEVYKPNLQCIRYKSTKNKQSQSAEESSDSDSEDEKDFDEGIPDKSAKIVAVKVPSLRTDLLIKAGLSVARNKVEKLFYESRIRVNGEKILKKSAQLDVGDEVDVIRSLSPMNPEFLLVSRIEILSVKAGEEHIAVKLRRFKSLTVENYRDPWKESADAT